MPMPVSPRPLAALLLTAGVALGQSADPLPERALARFGTTRFRPAASVTALAFSPDGQRLACWGHGSGTGDRFSLWEAGSGKEVRTTSTASGLLMALAWPADGPGLAVLRKGEGFGAASELMVWDFTAERPAELPKPVTGARIGGIVRVGGPKGRPVTTYGAAAVSANGKRLAVLTSLGDQPDAVVVFELKPAASVKELKRLTAFDPPPVGCTAVAFSPDGKWLVGVGRVLKDGKWGPGATIVVWDAAGKVARTVETPPTISQGGRLPLAVSDRSAALGLEDGGALLMDLGGGEPRTLASGHKAEKGRGTGTSAAAFAPDGKALVTAGRDGRVRVTEIESGKVKELGRHRSWPEALAVTRDGKRVASAGQDGLIRVWDVAAGTEAVPVGGHPSIVWRVSASADGKTVLTEGGDETIHVWDAAAGAERRRIPAGGPVMAAQLTPDGQRVVAVVGEWEKPERALKVWDAATGADATPAGFPKALTAGGFRITRDGNTLLTWTEDKLAAWAWPAGTKLWAADMAKPTAQGINSVGSVAVSPDGRHFVTVACRTWHREERGMRFGYAADGIVDLWETATGKRVRRLVESPGCFNPAVFAADGTLIHTGGGKFPNDVRAGGPAESRAHLCVVDPLTGRLVREFAPAGRADTHDTGRAAALSGDGKVLYLGTGIGEVLAFEVASGSLRAAYPGHRGNVLAVDTPANDIRRVASGSADTTALWWDVGFGGKGAAPSADDRKALWAALTNADGKAAYEAMTKLAGDPTEFVAHAASESKPAPPGPTAADLAPIFRDLDAKTFAAREAASAALDKYGEPAIALVRTRLETETSAEVRERLTKFLDRHTKPATDPERLRQGRALELLEHLGTPEAKGLLEKLAAGGPSRLTADAAAAVKRLAGR
jgi:WD40 repeat protein